MFEHVSFVEDCSGYPQVSGHCPGWLKKLHTQLKEGGQNFLTYFGMSAIADDNETGTVGTVGAVGSDQSSHTAAAKSRSTPRRHVSEAWSICAIKRSIAWVDPTGVLAFQPLVCPPVPMSCKAAEWIWASLFVNGLNGQVTKAVELWQKAAFFRVKIRCLDSAKENRRVMGYENWLFELSDVSILHFVVWCTMHNNGHILGSCITGMGLTVYNMVFSASLLARIGNNFNALLNNIPSWVRRHVEFSPFPPPLETGVLCYWIDAPIQTQDYYTDT